MRSSLLFGSRHNSTLLCCASSDPPWLGGRCSLITYRARKASPTISVGAPHSCERPHARRLTSSPLLMPRSSTYMLMCSNPVARGLHSSTFQVNVSKFCGIRWVVTVTKTAQGHQVTSYPSPCRRAAAPLAAPFASASQGLNTTRRAAFR
jgi:hypothetical protein